MKSVILRISWKGKKKEGISLEREQGGLTGKLLYVEDSRKCEVLIVLYVFLVELYSKSNELEPLF
jgi:hypothetical protein